MKAIGILQWLQLLQVQSLQTINYGSYCSKGDLGTGQNRNKTQHEAIKIHNLSYNITKRKCYCHSLETSQHGLSRGKNLLKESLILN